MPLISNCRSSFSKGKGQVIVIEDQEIKANSAVIAPEKRGGVLSAARRRRERP